MHVIDQRKPHAQRKLKKTKRGINKQLSDRKVSQGQSSKMNSTLAVERPNGKSISDRGGLIETTEQVITHGMT